MENKIYFKVQDVKQVSCGYKTYTRTIEKVTYYEEDEIKKAIKHFKKRKANDIIMCCVEYLDKAPYTKTTEDFGERHYIGVMDKEYDGTVRECIDFYDFSVRHYI